jgi:acetyltransferase-like isoleucine patch superfamily enzyme
MMWRRLTLRRARSFEVAAKVSDRAVVGEPGRMIATRPERVSIGERCRWDVDVVCNGEGHVELGSEIAFGYALAPIVGDGRILLQARTAEATVSVGDRTEFSNNVAVVANQLVRIGADCLIGDLVRVFDSDFHELDPELRLNRRQRTVSHALVSPTVIGDNVWLGSRVIVMRGASVGDHSVIAAGAVVSGEIPASVLAGGVPARVIRDL